MEIRYELIITEFRDNFASVPLRTAVVHAAAMFAKTNTSLNCIHGCTLFKRLRENLFSQVPLSYAYDMLYLSGGFPLCGGKKNCYSVSMTLYEYYMVFPDGDTQEISDALAIGSLYDMNGNRLMPPLPTNKMIVYQVAGKHTREERGTVLTYYILEQLDAAELLAYI